MQLRIEAAHTNVVEPKAMGRKTPDYSAVPLCFWHHRGNSDSYHHLGERAFEARHGISLEGLVQELNQAYRQTLQSTGEDR